MFTLNKITFTDEKKNYFSNYSQLTKDLLKIIRLISYREKSLNTCVENVKYNQIIHFFKNTLDDREFTINTLENLSVKLKYYLLDKIKISEDIIDEIIILFFFNIENKHKQTIKQSLLKKINLRIQKIETFFDKRIYFEKRRTKKENIEIEQLKKLINTNTYDDFNQIKYEFIQAFTYYSEFINKKYNYVLKPKEFINYCEIFGNFLEKNKEILNNLNLYQQIKDLKDFLEELVYIVNMKLLSSEIQVSPSFYLEQSYVETEFIDYEISASHHGGKKFAHIIIGKSPLFYLKQKEMKDKFSDKKILQKIVWDWDEPEFLDIKTYNENFICDIDYSRNSIFFVKNFINESNNKTEFELLGTYECEEVEMFDIKTYAHFNNVKIDGKKLKNFFLFKTDKDCYEINIENREMNIILKLKFFIDRLEILNCINKNKLIKTYNSLLEN